MPTQWVVSLYDEAVLVGGGDLLQTEDQAIIHWPYNELVTPTTRGSSPSPQ